MRLDGKATRRKQDFLAVSGVAGSERTLAHSSESRGSASSVAPASGSATGTVRALARKPSIALREAIVSSHERVTEGSRSRG